MEKQEKDAPRRGGFMDVHLQKHQIKAAAARITPIGKPVDAPTFKAAIRLAASRDESRVNRSRRDHPVEKRIVKRSRNTIAVNATHLFEPS
jgi:hypothetical protein